MEMESLTLFTNSEAVGLLQDDFHLFSEVGSLASSDLAFLAGAVVMLDHSIDSVVDLGLGPGDSN